MHALSLLFLAAVVSGAHVASEFPACGTAGLHGAVNKTDVSDFRAGECAVFVSHEHEAVYITAADYPRVMTLVGQAFCDGYQCHPGELTRYHAVRGATMEKYFVFTFVKNPWMRALRSRASGGHASCAIGRVDYVGRVEHAVADWKHMLAVRDRGREAGPPPDGPPDGPPAGCADVGPELEYAVSQWFADDIEAFRFPRPADPGRLFYPRK